MRRLAHPCQAITNPPTGHGKRNLKLLAQGRLPYKVTSWPIDGAVPLADPKEQLALRSIERDVERLSAVFSQH